MSLLILTLLAALLSAVFFRQRRSGYRATCGSNLAQIHLGIQMYVQDNDSYFPSVISWSDDIENYIKGKDIFVCPAFSRDSKGVGIDYSVYPERLSSLHLDKSGSHELLAANESLVSNPDKWILIVDSGHEDNFAEDIRMYPSDCAQILTRQPIKEQSSFEREFCTIHDGGGNYLFADGHVKWLLPQRAIETDCEAGSFLPGEWVPKH